MNVRSKNRGRGATWESGTIVSFRKFFVLTWSCLLATATIAGEDHRTRIQIDIDDEDGQAAFMFDSEDAGFDLHDLAIGERRQLVDEAGNVANVLRTEDGFELDVNGRKVDLAELHGGHDVEMHMHPGDADTDVIVVGDARKVKKVRMIKTDDDEVVTIISTAAIDNATRELIREALRSSGQNGDVVFIDGSDLKVNGDKQAHGRHEVRVIRKKVDVTN